MASSVIEQAIIDQAIPAHRTVGREYRDLGRIVLQGLTLGAADEMEAGLRSLYEGKPYKEIRADIMSGIQKKRKDFPVGAFALEMTGGAAPALLSAGQTLPATLGRSAGLGAAYGYMSAEPGTEIQEAPADIRRLSQMFAGGLFSGIGGAATSRMFPERPPEAGQLIKKGVPLTFGQAAGKGSFPNRMEDLVMNTIPAISDLAGTARVNATKQFNRVAVNEALDPIGVKVPANLQDIDEFATFATQQIDAAYDDVFSKITIPDRGALDAVNASIDDILAKYKDYEGFEFISKTLTQTKARAGRAVDDPKQLVFVFKNLRDMGRKRQASLDPKQQESGDALVEAADAMIESVLNFNQDIIPAYRAAQQSYGNFVPIRDAFAKAVSKDNEFVTPRQLLSEISRQDTTKGRRRLFGGALPGQELAKAAEATLGSQPLPSGSQTAGRLTGLQLLTGGGLGAAGYADPVGTVSTLAPLAGMYMFPEAGRKIAGGVGVPIFRGSGVTVPGILSERPVIAAQNLGLLEQVP